jgi:WD40 repeat protein
VKVWDLESGTVKQTFDKHANRVLCVAFSPDGNRVASGDQDGMLRVWEPNGREVAPAHSHTGPVQSVGFSPDGKRVAVASGYPFNGELKLWPVD